MKLGKSQEGNLSIVVYTYILIFFLVTFVQGFEREKDGNRGKFIDSNFVIFCYKEFEKFGLCKFVSQSEATFIVSSEPIKSGHEKINPS